TPIRSGYMPSAPIRILHLSDLHFDTDTAPATKFRWLADDLRLGLHIQQLEYLVISGDVTDKGGNVGFEKAREFVVLLMNQFGLAANRCILVPGNHDVQDLQTLYTLRKSAKGMSPEYYYADGGKFRVRNQEQYPLRLQRFSDAFFQPIRGQTYP